MRIFYWLSRKAIARSQISFLSTRLKRKRITGFTGHVFTLTHSRIPKAPKTITVST